MKTAILKPGYLVSLKTALRGGVTYARVDIERDHTTEEGARVAEWQTKRRIADAAEYEAASVARSKARSLVVSQCCASSFGLLCPLANEEALNDAVTAARAVAQLHNASAASTFVDVYVLAGRIAQDSEEAERALSAELRELLDAMQAGIKAADPEAIRAAANKARALGGMLSDGVASRVSDAVTEARKAARDIVRRVEKAGETAAAVAAECSTARIEAARFAFLDLDGAATIAPEAPAARGLDLEPERFPDAPEGGGGLLAAPMTRARAIGEEFAASERAMAAANRGAEENYSYAEIEGRLFR